MRPVQLLPVIAFSACLCLPLANRPRVLVGLSAGQAGRPPSPDVIEERWRASFPLRDEGRQLVGTVRRHLLDEHGSPAVVVGADGWLFYRGEGAADGHTFDALRGQAPWSDERCARIAGELRRRAAQVAAWGGRYLVAVVPDKAVVYAEALPRHLRPLPGRSRTDQLLAAAGDEVLDLRPALAAARAAAPTMPLFWHSDSHWNEWGRQVAFAAIARRLGDGPVVAVEPAGLAVVTVPGVPDPRDPEHTRPGELFHLLDRLADPDWLHDQAVDGLPVPAARQVPPFVADPLAWQPQLGGHRVPWAQAYAVHARCDEADLPGPLLVLHDSFGSFPMGGLADRYAASTFLWTHQWDDQEAARLHPAVVVHLVAERYLDALLPR
jgi:hypothetical protein